MCDIRNKWPTDGWGLVHETMCSAPITSYGFSRMIHSLQTADSLFCENENPCVNGGICTYLGNSQYTCDCPLGYNGTNCESGECMKNWSMYETWVVV